MSQRIRPLFIQFLQSSPLLLFVAFVSASAQPIVPDTGAVGLYQRALELKHDLNVLSVALQPGDEDLEALAYFRYARGARVLSAFVTNGESGESDVVSESPLQLAARRREEAAGAVRSIGGDVFFLNMPEIAAARDTAALATLWDRDTLQHRLMRLISWFKPDILLLARDWEWGSESPRWTMLRRDLLAATERIAVPAAMQDAIEFLPYTRWSVNRLMVDDGSGKGLTLAVQSQHPLLKKSYAELGRAAAGAYASMRERRALLRGDVVPTYRRVWPRGGIQITSVDQGLPPPVNTILRSTSQAVTALANALAPRSLPQIGGQRTALLRQTAAAIDSVDARIARSHELRSRDRKTLLNWKESLEKLRLELLGVRIHHTFSEIVLTDRQLTYLTIDSVGGIPKEGTTEIFFPAVGKDWVLNESQENRLPLAVGQPYRLLLMSATPYDTPKWVYGLNDHTVGRPFYFFVIHKNPKRELNFYYRSITHLSYAPRFVIEVLTPIVRAIEWERLVVKLTNNSRDGVADVVAVDDTLAASTRSRFRLNEKGATHTDTLLLSWKVPLPDGTSIVPILIHDEPVAHFAARSFDVSVDSTKRVGVWTGLVGSPAVEAIRRLPLQPVFIQHLNEASLAGLDVLVVDRRSVPSAQGQREEERRIVLDFARAGGHVLVLAQPAEQWAVAPIVDGIRLERTWLFEAEGDVEVMSEHALLSRPNSLEGEDWGGWLYRRAENLLRLDSPQEWEVPMRDARTGYPLLVTRRVGAGRITYVDLSLHFQWMNINPTAFRLLANLLAY